jgi:hypothetical protein
MAEVITNQDSVLGIDIGSVSLSDVELDAGVKILHFAVRFWLLRQ